MYKILDKEELAPTIYRIEVSAPLIAERAKAGNFVVLKINERGERIPLTIVSADADKGTITLIFQVIGKTTAHLATLRAGGHIQDLLGPLGHPTQIDDFGCVVVIGGGVGTAELFPIAKAMSEAGNYVISLIGARNKELMILEHEIRRVTDEVWMATDDGSCGLRGLVTDLLKKLLENGAKIDRVVAIGPLPMMRAIALITAPLNIKTIVSLSSNMVDATGMCGTCRVTVGGDVKFTCVDGPEFDAARLDFTELMSRDKRFSIEERASFERFKKEHKKCYE
ncbi:MAG: ferredoxin-NADP reductase [Candidatus Omnitrophica bacterium CG1_02_49_10]|nr:MAG: ferredoxin-NADP reductase [Candidatus Omnitrophica bacterium CG1_02_49_10]